MLTNNRSGFLTGGLVGRSYLAREISPWGPGHQWRHLWSNHKERARIRPPSRPNAPMRAPDRTFPLERVLALVLAREKCSKALR